MFVYRFVYYNLATFEVLVLSACADAGYIVVYPQIWMWSTPHDFFLLSLSLSLMQRCHAVQQIDNHETKQTSWSKTSISFDSDIR
jgi:hypothetical protein